MLMWLFKIDAGGDGKQLWLSEQKPNMFAYKFIIAQAYGYTK